MYLKHLDRTKIPEKIQNHCIRNPNFDVLISDQSISSHFAHNVESTLIQRHDVESILIQRCVQLSIDR